MDVLSVAEMARADEATIAGGTSGFELMRRAGQAVARSAAEMSLRGPILIVVGRGNNGGDGFVAATELAASGRDVSVVLLCDCATLKGDAALAAAEWKEEVLPCDPKAIGNPSLIIDALFGAGLNRAVKGDPHAMIEAMNANGAPILSVDLPSGIHGDTGEILGVAVNATRTLTFFRRKPAHLLLPGRIHCGEDAVVADEVRNLAMRSAEAAKSTSALIEEAVQNADGGVSINKEVLVQLSDITARVTQVGDVMRQIASASAQQLKGTEEISASVKQMNSVTQEVAARSEESASAAEELGGQAEGLREMVSNFELTTRKVSHPAQAFGAVRRSGTPSSTRAESAIPFGNARRNGTGNGSSHGRSNGKLSVLDQF